MTEINDEFRIPNGPGGCGLEPSLARLQTKAASTLPLCRRSPKWRDRLADGTTGALRQVVGGQGPSGFVGSCRAFEFKKYLHMAIRFRQGYGGQAGGLDGATGLGNF